MIIKKGDIIVADKVKIAGTFFSRLIGLLNRKNLNSNEGLLFKGSVQIHTFFMRFPIDVIFLDKNKKILEIYDSMPPFRITKIFLKSQSGYVLELSHGIAKSKFLAKNDILDFEDNKN